MWEKLFSSVEIPSKVLIKNTQQAVVWYQIKHGNNLWAAEIVDKINTVTLLIVWLKH